MRTMTHLAFAAIAASALALAGCGGGGSSTSQVAPPAAPAAPSATTPADTTPTPATVTLPALPMAAEHAFALAAGEHTIMAGESLAAGGVMLDCAAGGEDCVVTVADDGTVTATGGTVSASLTTAAATALEEETMAAAEMKTQRAIGQGAALAGGGSGTAQTFTVTRGAGKSASISGAAGFTAAAEQPGMLGKFAGIARVNTSSASATQHLVVYTDIAAPKLAEFFDFDGDSDTTPVYAEASTGDGFITLIPGSATLSTGQGRFSGGNVDSSIFPQKAATPAGGSTPKKFSVNAKALPTDASNNIVSLPGTFDGASGRYTCTPTAVADGCTVSVSSAGVYSFVGNSDVWRFTPNTGAKAYREDSEFLSFGWWMSEPAKATGTYSFDTHYGGLAYAAFPTTDATGAGVTGDATYTGNAAGRYVVGDEAGAFTADATLTAKFGNATDIGSISGSITNFQGAAGGMSGWSVALKKINMTDLTAAPAFVTSVTDSSASTYNGTVATLGDVTAHGTWQGAFFGNQKNPAGIAVRNTENAAPLAVAGEFHADGAGANIAGAFGARR